ncbi:MAG: YkgJ family cysteine cluster protein [Gemmataceae bacterium]|nr:YkgJ family cysteine cluster protein [Gemmataceae bacterium]
MSSDSDTPQPGYDTCNIHLRMLGEDRTFTVPVPLGKRTLLDLLPAARELTGQAMAVAVDQEARQGRPISCASGCSACCRHLVAVSPAEAQDLADFVAELPAERQAAVRERFAEAKRKFESIGLLVAGETHGERGMHSSQGANHSERVRTLSYRYFQEQIACPFLENDTCIAYERRPMVCREHCVTSPAENCAHLDGSGVRPVTPPIDMAPVLARAGKRLLGMKAQTVPLILALEWSERNCGPLRQEHDGVELLQTIVEECDRNYDQDFESRSDYVK